VHLQRSTDYEVDGSQNKAFRSLEHFFEAMSVGRTRTECCSGTIYCEARIGWPWSVLHQSQRDYPVSCSGHCKNLMLTQSVGKSAYIPVNSEEISGFFARLAAFTKSGQPYWHAHTGVTVA